MNHQAFLAGVW